MAYNAIIVTRSRRKGKRRPSSTMPRRKRTRERKGGGGPGTCDILSYGAASVRTRSPFSHVESSKCAGGSRDEAALPAPYRDYAGLHRRRHAQPCCDLCPLTPGLRG